MSKKGKMTLNEIIKIFSDPNSLERTKRIWGEGIIP